MWPPVVPPSRASLSEEFAVVSAGTSAMKTWQALTAAGESKRPRRYIYIGRDDSARGEGVRSISSEAAIYIWQSVFDQLAIPNVFYCPFGIH